MIMPRGEGGPLPFLAFAAILVLAGLAIAPADAAAETLDRPTVIEEDLLVPEGSVLALEEKVTLAPAADTDPELVVRGGLLVDGTRGSPVTIQVPIRIEGGDGSPVLFRNATIEPLTTPACGLAVDPDRPGRIENTRVAEAVNGICIPSPSEEMHSPKPDTDDQSIVNTLGFAHPSSGLTNALRSDDTDQPTKRPFAWSDPLNEGLDLHNVQLEGNRGVGLNLSTLPPHNESPPVHATELTVADNTVGIQSQADAPKLEVAGARIEGNNVGVASSGGRIHLDHTEFRDNEDWDIRQIEPPGAVTWTSTSFEPTCSNVGDRPYRGCHPGAIPASTLTLILGVVYGLLFLVSEVGRYLIVRVGLWLRLYSRIPPDELLEEERRRELIEHIRQEPGIHLRQLVRETEGGYGSTVYHLQRLEKAGFIRSRREGLYRRFYAGQQAPDEAGKTSTRDRVLETIRQQQGIHAAEIARILDTTRQLVSYHVRKLVDDALVEKRPGKNCIHLFPSDNASRSVEDPSSSPQETT
jgi:predicted transcriptional regulator